jgi:hypothetical protein
LLSLKLTGWLGQSSGVGRQGSLPFFAEPRQRKILLDPSNHSDTQKKNRAVKLAKRRKKRRNNEFSFLRLFAIFCGN